MKAWLKSKYLLLLPVGISVLVIALAVINSSQSGTTQQELQETFNNRNETVQLIINSTLTKDRAIGLTSEEQQSLESLLLKEQYIKEILTKLKEGNLNITSEQLAFINEYEKYITLKHHIPYLNVNQLKEEARKAEHLLYYDLSYTEQITPSKTTLLSKQLFQILFSPITAFLLLLIFCYSYISDRENRTFDFFKMNSLSSVAIYYGYLIPILLIVLSYTFLAIFLSLLPPLLTGNIHTVFYPIEVAVNSENVLVPVWKWLLFIPIGWSVFIAFLLLMLISLFKHRASLGVLFAVISLPVSLCYVLSLKMSFHIVNPIHLVTSYETHLLASNQYVPYLSIMLALLVAGFFISYMVIRMKEVHVHLPQFQTTKKQYQSSGKFKLLNFEHVKKKRKGHTLITLILLIVSFGGIVVVVNQQYESIPTRALKAIEDAQRTTLEFRTNWELLAANFELDKELQFLKDGTEISDGGLHENSIKQLDDQYEILERLKDEIYSKDFPDTYRKAMQNPGSYKDDPNTSHNVSVMASEEQQNLLDEKGITPWAIGSDWVSKFSDPSQAISNEHYKLLKEYQERNTKYDNSSLFAVYKFFDWNVMFLICLIFVLLLWTTMSDERRPTPTINFLRTKPIRFQSIYRTKWLYNLLVAYSLLLISGGVLFVIATIIGGIGEAQYPILIYATERIEENFFYSHGDDAYFYFENLLTLIVKSGILVFAQIFFLNSMFSLIGKFMRNHYAVIVVTCIIAIAGYMFGNQYIAMDSSMYNPFIYFDTWNIVDGWKSIEASNGSVNFQNGTIILFISGSLLFCLGLLSKRKVTT